MRKLGDFGETLPVPDVGRPGPEHYDADDEIVEAKERERGVVDEAGVLKQEYRHGVLKALRESTPRSAISSTK